MEAPKIDYDLTVFQHKNKSYIKEKYNFKSYLVNGTEVERCKGNTNYGFYDGIVKTIQQKKSKGGERVKWVLKPQWLALPETEFPREYAANQFQSYYDSDDDEDERTRSTFYESQYSEKEEYLEDVSFEIVEVSVAPFSLPTYIKVKFPASLTEFPEFQHVFPCWIDYRTVFLTVKDKIKEFIGKHPKDFSLTEYSNLQTITVKQRILIPDSIQKPTTVSYYPTMRSRKTKTKRVTYTEKWVDVLKLVGDYQSDRNSHEQVESVEGNNYEECMANLWKVCDEYVARLDPDVLCVCESCNGRGIVKKEEEKKNEIH